MCYRELYWRVGEAISGRTVARCSSQVAALQEITALLRARAGRPRDIATAIYSIYTRENKLNEPRGKNPNHHK